MSQNPPCHFVGSVHSHASPVPLQLPCTHPGKSMQTLQFTLSHPTSQAQMSGPSQMPCSQPLLHTGVAHGIRGSVSPTFVHPFWHVMLPFESQVYLVCPLMFAALQGKLSISSGVRWCLAQTLVARASMARPTNLNIFDTAPGLLL